MEGNLHHLHRSPWPLCSASIMATCRSDTWATMQSTLLIGLPALALSQVRDMADMTYSIGSVLMHKPHIHKLHSCLFQYVPWISSRSRVIHIMLSKTYLTFPHFHLIGCLIYTVIINQLPHWLIFRLCAMVGGLVGEHSLRPHPEEPTEAWRDQLQDTNR